MRTQVTVPARRRAIPPGMHLPGWPILPLRVFLGASFLLAGLDKLADPGFLDPAARTYLGRQIQEFAPGTPLESFLLHFAAPNATLFGLLTMGGELCVGLAVLLGLLTRVSALAGLSLSLTFYLSVTWNVHPFYFGADLPYAAGWITLLLAGPGPLALDQALRRWLAGAAAGDRAATPVTAHAPHGRRISRRAFLGLGAASAAGLLVAGAGAGWGVLHPRRALPIAALPAEGATPTPGVPASAPPVPASATPAPTPGAPASATPAAATDVAEPVAPVATAVTPAGDAATPGAGRRLLAAAGALPVDEALAFTLPGGDPAVLVHSARGYRAYVALCTHNGCEVAYQAGVLACPCHGATYDPAAGGKVLEGPAPRPLSPVAIAVAADGAVYLAGDN